MSDPFDIPAVYKADGWSYQWVRKSLLGEDDYHNIKQFEDSGWRWIPKDSHFSDAPGSPMWRKDTDWIEYCGLVFMRRPHYLTLMAEAKQRQQNFEMANHWNGGDGPRFTEPTPVKKPNIWQRVIKAIRNEGR